MTECLINHFPYFDLAYPEKYAVPVSASEFQLLVALKTCPTQISSISSFGIYHPDHPQHLRVWNQEKKKDTVRRWFVGCRGLSAADHV